MKDIKLIIDGKEIPLTEAQMRALGIEVNENPFQSVDYYKNYYYINSFGVITRTTEKRNPVSTDFQNAVNYFNDEAFAKQVALHQLLYRKLLKFTYDNKCEDLEWDGNNEHYYIRYDYYWQYFDVEMARSCKSVGVFFSSKEDAQRAIKEVVEPFVKEHPEFVW